MSGAQAGAPLVSVVLPTHNRVDLLPKALGSVLAQTLPALEVIVIDEASQDATPEYLERIGDPRVRVIRHDPAQGVVRARNAGIAAATAPWIAFIDDDDIWAPDKLERQLAAVAATPGARWSCVGALVVDERLAPNDIRRPPASGDAHAALVRANVIPGGGSGVLVATELLRAVGAFRLDIKAAEDWECWIRLAAAAPIAAVDAPLLAYRRSLGSRAHATGRHARAYRKIRELHPASDPVAANLEPQMRFLAHQEVRNGRRRAAAQRMLRTARSGRRRNAIFALGFLAVPPGWERLLGRVRSKPALRRDWERQVDSWLAPYR